MKTKLFLSISLFALLTVFSCTSVRTFSTGLPNEAYLEFVGKPSDFKGGVNVTIDGTTKFVGIVKKDYADTPKGYVYAISKGTHTVTITYKDKVIYNDKIFVSPQETKKIILP